MDLAATADRYKLVICNQHIERMEKGQALVQNWVVQPLLFYFLFIFFISMLHYFLLCACQEDVTMHDHDVHSCDRRMTML